eukprot:CAMPEP_0170198462 /NCGR_PEP_ID=MMETSP0040_2-20121228/68782_1 /TAXON_ID=641309 /ORGANISM="Lotharella oceanica, Strain CCMP622" /LENGTH=427 /DNA_ID=CAMNT_0010448447 /DNA_START=45 /DNA_END=1328 /DNA_ORIENTATION=+
MGACSSAPDVDTSMEGDSCRPRTLEISSIRRNSCLGEMKKAKPLRLLILGAGASGKSSLAKQMNHMYGTGYSKLELEFLTPILYGEIIRAVQSLINLMERVAEEKGTSIAMNSKLEDVRIFQEMDSMAERSLSVDLAAKATAFWTDPDVQEAYAERMHEFDLPEFLAYFLDKAEAIAAPGYVASVGDYIRSYTRTTGIFDSRLYSRPKFTLVDVGGQRSQRKKWRHCFKEDISAVLFTVGLSGYHECLEEDPTTNRLVEALTLYEEVCNAEWSQKATIFLLLNKRDVFKERIKRIDIRECPALEKFEGDSKNFMETLAYIKDCFLQRSKNHPDVHCHATCATDRSDIAMVFRDVSDATLDQYLKENFEAKFALGKEVTPKSAPCLLTTSRASRSSRESLRARWQASSYHQEREAAVRSVPLIPENGG